MVPFGFVFEELRGFEILESDNMSEEVGFCWKKEGAGGGGEIDLAKL